MRDSVIIVDDNRSDLMVANWCYKKTGAPFPWLMFHSPESFREHLASLKANGEEPPRLVLLDVDMPTESGFDLVPLIKSDPYFAATTKVKMLTGSTSKSDRDRADELGADGYLIKPKVASAYIEMLVSHVLDTGDPPQASA